MFPRIFFLLTLALSLCFMASALPTESTRFPTRAKSLQPRQSSGSTAQTYKIRSQSDPTQYLGTQSVHEFVSVRFVDEKYASEFTLPTTGQLEGVNIMTMLGGVDRYLAFYSNGPGGKADGLSLVTSTSIPSPNSFYTNAFTIPSTFPGALTATYSPGTGTDPLQTVSFAQDNGGLIYYVTPEDYQSTDIELMAVELEVVQS